MHLSAGLCRHAVDGGCDLSEHSISLSELMGLVAWLGLPVFSLGAAALVVLLWLHYRANFSWLRVVLLLLAMLSLAVPMTTLFWFLLAELPVSEQVFMIGGFINLPAVTAMVVLVPVSVRVYAALVR